MSQKIIVAVLAAVVVIAVAGVALFMMNNNVDEIPSDGILYDGNGGKLSGGETTYKSHTTTVETCSFQKEGYHWVVWNTKADGSGTDYSENSIAPAKTRLYAQWSNANVFFGSNDNADYISIFVADSDGSNEVNIDNGYAPVSSTSVFIVKPQTGVTLKIHVDGQSVIAEKADGKMDIEYSTGITGISFEKGKIREDGAAVFEIKQTVFNQNVILNCSSSSVSDVLDVRGTRDVPTEVMTFSLGVGDPDDIDINGTGSVEVGSLAKIYVKAVKSGSTVSYDGDDTISIITDKTYEIVISFSNGGALTGVVIDGDTAIISFTYDSDKDPVFNRIISHN